MRGQVLQAIHLGHQGETKCILLARESVFWPGISNDIRQMVKDCDLCNHHQPAQPKLPIMQPDLPTRPWEKLGTDIFEFNGKKYLMIVDYYSRFPVIRLLSDMSSHTVCNHFTSVLAEYGLPTTIISDFGSQYVSERFKTKCKQSGITLCFSSPYHHQANSLAERTVGTCKSLLRKALEKDEYPYAALWMYRTTPLDSQIPSPYELLFGRKPQTTLPSTRSALKSKHLYDDLYQEANQKRQEKQAEFYDRKAGNDKRILNNMEPVFVRNTLKNTWEPAIVLNRPNPVASSRTYTVDIQGKVYQRTREHLRPRSKNKVMPLPSRDPTPVPTEVPTHKPIDASEAKVSSITPPIEDRTDPKGDSLTLDQPPSAQRPCSPLRPSSEPANTAATMGKPWLSAKEPSHEVRACYSSPSQVQRLGRAQEK